MSPATVDNDRITQLNDKFVDLMLQQNPLLALIYGIRGRYEDRIFNCSKEFHLYLVNEMKALLVSAKHVSPCTLQQEQDLAFLITAIERILIREGIPGEKGYVLELSNNHMIGELQGLEQDFKFQPMETIQDLHNYRTRLSQLRTQCHYMIENFQSGITRNATLNKVGTEMLIKICDGLTGNGVDLPTAARRSGLNRAAAAEILVGDADFLVPVIQDALSGILAVKSFLETQYLPFARTSDGISNLADSQKVYEGYIYEFTDSFTSAEEWHQLGLSEVSRIEKLLEEAKRNCGYIGSLVEFRRDLLDKQKYPHLYFPFQSNFPPLNARVEPVPKGLELQKPIGSYYPGTKTIEPYLDGWALYSEFLGEELGIYTDPFEIFGRLEMEMLRAIRLVVDTGLHSKGWSINQCVEYMTPKLAMTRDGIITEVNRYTVYIGQALSYKAGELKIKQLRRFAEQELGPDDRFSLAEFHSVVLESGALPLGMLETVVCEWVGFKKAGGFVSCGGVDSKMLLTPDLKGKETLKLNSNNTSKFAMAVLFILAVAVNTV
ncbi:hypothetical protein BDR26DRAFT_866315, partial [Obelidium mucronatum]